MTANADIREQALDWAVQTGDPSFEDWDAFTDWLEADPRHGKAYDAVAASVREASELVADAAPANDPDEAPETGGVGRRGVLGGAIAASIALLAGLWFFSGGERDLYRIETAPGEIRSIALDEGTRVDIGGGSAIMLDHDDPRFAELQRGRALFTVTHDEASPFEVLAGGERLVDIGTVFEVAVAGEALELGVSEGAVMINPQADAIRVSRGQRVVRTTRQGGFARGAIGTERIGEWREGRLTFEEVGLEEVARRLTDTTGVVFEAAPGASAQRISGSIAIDPVRADPAMIGPLLGIAVERRDSAWVVGAP